jgi:hypothetical protein
MLGKSAGGREEALVVSKKERDDVVPPPLPGHGGDVHATSQQDLATSEAEGWRLPPKLSLPATPGAGAWEPPTPTSRRSLLIATSPGTRKPPMPPVPRPTPMASSTFGRSLEVRWFDAPRPSNSSSSHMTTPVVQNFNQRHGAVGLYVPSPDAEHRARWCFPHFHSHATIHHFVPLTQIGVPRIQERQQDHNLRPPALGWSLPLPFDHRRSLPACCLPDTNSPWGRRAAWEPI